MRHTALAAIGAVLLFAGSNAALAAAQDDETFLKKAVGINLGESDLQGGDIADIGRIGRLAPAISGGTATDRRARLRRGVPARRR